MTDTKISSLPVLTSVDSTDMFAVVDTSAGSTKQVTRQNLEQSLSITPSQVSNLAVVATTGDFDDLINPPSLADISANSSSEAENTYTLTSDTDLKFEDSSNAVMFYMDESTGNLGVQTTDTEDAALNVQGTIRASRSDATGFVEFFSQSSNNATPRAGFRMGNAANDYTNVGLFVIPDGSLQKQSRLEVLTNNDTSSTDTKRLGIVVDTTGGSFSIANGYGNTNDLPMLFKLGSSEVARFSTDGNMGVGTNNPGTKLDVSGVITATGGTSTNWNTAYGWGDHSTAGYLSAGDSVTDLDATAWRFFYSNASGDITELALGSSGSYLQSQGASSAPTWSVPAGSGDVSKVGTPVDNQVGVWTGDGTIEGTSGFTYDGSTLAVTGNITVTGTVDGIDIATDVAANTAKVSADGSIATHSDVTITSLGTDELLFTQDGSTWINQTLSEAGIQGVLSEGAFVDGDKTKLDGIETAADVTDATNVAAAGAVMDGDFGSNGLMQRTGAGTYSVKTAPSGDVVGTSDTQTLTNKTLATGSNTVTLFTEAHATSHTLSAAECYGAVYYVTGAATLTLPAVAAGMSLTVITIGAVAVSIDPNASDLIYLDGTALDDGDKITNTSTAGDIAVLTYYDSTGWHASTNGWTDGGA